MLVVGLLAGRSFSWGFMPNAGRGPSRENVEMLLMFHHYWQAYEEATKLISSQNRGVPNAYYRLRIRATLAMGMEKEVLDDCTAMERNKPSSEDLGFAYDARFRINILTGNFNAARKAAMGDRSKEQMADQLAQAWQDAQKAASESRWGDAVPLLDSVVQQCQVFRPAQVLRMDAAFHLRDFQTYSQYHEKLKPEGPETVYRVSVIHFCQGRVGDAISQLKGQRHDLSSAGLKLFQEWEAKSKQVGGKKGNVTMALERMQNISQDFCPGGSEIFTKIGGMELKYARETLTPDAFMEKLNGIIDRAPNHHDARMERGELLMQKGDWSAARADFQYVAQATGSRRAHESAQRAEQKEREANYVDYYAILGVDKRASEADIQAAYRRKVRELHPDRHPGKEAKERADREMKLCNQARDILGDTRKRRLYDAGQDPESGGGGFEGGGFPFHDFSQFFGGGGPFQQFGGGGGGFQHFEFRFG